MELRDLSDISMDEIVTAFQNAFSDYAVGFDRTQISRMLIRRGYVGKLSFAAFECGRIVAFTLTGIGEYSGVRSCYDCATGVSPEYRGRGLSRELLGMAMRRIRDCGVSRYVLEVLQSNDKAISLYYDHGFRIVRDYDCYNQSVEALRFTKITDPGLDIRSAGIEVVGKMASFCDFAPSWQNSLDSIVRGRENLIVNIARLSGTPVGYCVIDPDNGDIAQIAVSRNHRRQGIASSLLSSVMDYMHSPTMKALNIPTDGVSLKSFLEDVNFNKGLSQFEMHRDI